MTFVEANDFPPHVPCTDLLDAVQLLKRWTRKHPDTDLGLKTLDWLKRRNFRGSILRGEENR